MVACNRVVPAVLRHCIYMHESCALGMLAGYAYLMFSVTQTHYIVITVNGICVRTAFTHYKCCIVLSVIHLPFWTFSPSWELFVFP